MDLDTNKNLIKLSVFAILFILVNIGISYSYIKFSVEGKEENVIKAGCLKVELVEANEISLNNAVPMLDEVGMAQTPYQFVVKNSCTIDMNYFILFNVLNTSTIANLNKVKVAFSGSYLSSPTLIGSLPLWDGAAIVPSNVSRSYYVTSGTLQVGESKIHYLNMWIDYDVTSFTGTMKAKIMAYGVQTVE